MKLFQHSPRTFSLFLLSYSIVFVIPMLLFFYTYRESMRSLQENAQSISLANLENCRNSLEGQFCQLEDSAYGLARTSEVLSYAKEDNPYIDQKTPWQLRELQQVVDSLQIGNISFLDVFLYFNQSDVVVSSSGTHLSLDRFYGDFFQMDNYSLEDMRDLMNEYHYQSYLPAKSMFSVNQEELTTPQESGIPNFDIQPQDGILLLYSFPNFSTPEGQIVFSVSASQIMHNMTAILEQWDSTVYILDENQNLLFATESLDETEYLANKDLLLGTSVFEECHIFGRESLLVRSVSPESGWTYVMEVPQEAIYQDLKAPRRLLLIYACLVVVVGVCIILYLSWRNSSWIFGISKVITRWMEEENKPVAQKDNEFRTVQESIENLYRNRCEIKESMERQKPLMRTTFVEQLLKGEYTEDMDWYLRQLNFQKLEGKLAVLQVHFDLSEIKHDDEWIEHVSFMKRLCEKIFSAVFHSDIYYYDNSFELRTMVVGTGMSDEEQATNLLNQAAAECKKQLFENFAVKVRFSAGNLTESLGDIRQAYEEAGVCMSAGFLTMDRDILWPKDLQECKTTYFYPVQIEMQLIQNITRTTGGGIVALRKF